jgi:excisionase family DNA binding protein
MSQLQTPEAGVVPGPAYCPTCGAVRVNDPGLTVDEAADRLRLSRQTVLRWLHSGRLYGVKLGGDKSGYRIHPLEIERELSRLRRAHGR